MRTGRCQCGELRYESAGEPIALYVCHCRECRKQSAAAFGMSLEVPRAGLRLTQGTPKFWTRPTDSGRRVKLRLLPELRLARSGMSATSPAETLTIKAGSLDEPVDFSTAIHIWTSRKLPGMEIPADAQQFPGEPD